ncbi:MAG: ABC transporter ATP-binding protein [Fimbriimonadaceae bacterium]|nr:ABC transporter ATP-binding protein [Fimbriimonadaceae bacterium]
MLEVTGLVKEYKNLRAVDDLTFTIQPGEIVGLLGPNGAGKTTALRCIAGILRPNAGAIRINGYDLEQDQAKAKQALAFVPEMPSLYELLTVEEHLRFVAMCFNSLDKFEQNGDMLLERYVLLEKKKELVATLSKGMRQKLAIACAFIRDASVLLFDEPIIGIDPAGVAEVKAELNRARAAGCSILVSTHLLDTAERFCDRVIIVSRGRMLVQGTLEELRRTPGMEKMSLEDIFLKLTMEGVPASHEAPAVFEL